MGRDAGRGESETGGVRPVEKYGMVCTFLECQRCLRMRPPNHPACPTCDPEGAKANPPEFAAAFEYGKSLAEERNRIFWEAFLGRKL